MGSDLTPGKSEALNQRLDSLFLNGLNIRTECLARSSLKRKLNGLAIVCVRVPGIKGRGMTSVLHIEVLELRCLVLNNISSIV